MDMGVLKQFLRDEALAEHVATPVPDVSPGKTSKSGAATTLSPESDKPPKILSSHRLIMHIIVR